MSLNCSEINLILNELNLEGSFIQEIVQPSFDSLALYTYKPGLAKTVFISLEGGSCRINEVRRKIPKNEKPLRFNELLRSRIKGARITFAGQLGTERIVKISIFRDGPVYVMPGAQEKFAKKKKIDYQDEGAQNLNLYIRLWSNASNIFLCDEENRILDSFYRRPAKGELTGECLSLPQFTDADSEALKKFPVRDFAGIEFPLDNLSFNEKIDFYYSQNAARTSLESLLEQAEKWYNQHKSRQESALERLLEKQSAFRNSELYKHQGDLILSFGYLIDGTKNYLECQDYLDGKTIRIKIDPSKSAQENAASYYETYKKQTSGLEELEHDIERAKKAIEELDSEYQKLTTEKNPVKLEQLLRKKQTPKQKLQSERPGLSYEFKGWTILVGRDAGENDELLRHYVKGQDMWFHTRDFPGGYVFIKNRPGKTIPLELMLIAGNLALHYSKGRKNGKADLYYTQVKHLRRAKNGPKGLVLPTNEKNLFIQLDSAILRQLEDHQTE